MPLDFTTAPPELIEAVRIADGLPPPKAPKAAGPEPRPNRPLGPIWTPYDHITTEDKPEYPRYLWMVKGHQPW